MSVQRWPHLNFAKTGNLDVDAFPVGSPVFIVTPERREFDFKGRETWRQNGFLYLYHERRDAIDMHGNRQAVPGEIVSAALLWPEIPEIDRGIKIAEALAARSLVEIGIVESDGMFIHVRLNREGARFIYRTDLVARGLLISRTRSKYDPAPEIDPSVAVPLGMVRKRRLDEYIAPAIDGRTWPAMVRLDDFPSAVDEGFAELCGTMTMDEYDRPVFHLGEEFRRIVARFAIDQREGPGSAELMPEIVAMLTEEDPPEPAKPRRKSAIVEA